MNKARVVLLVAGLAMAAFGGYTLYDHYDQQREATAVEADVLSSSVALGDGRNPDGIDITYRYTIDGKSYTNGQVCPVVGATCESGRTDEFVENHPEGSTVTAYVDRDNPRDAYVIRPGPPYGFAFVGAFGLLFVVVAVGADDQSVRIER